LAFDDDGMARIIGRLDAKLVQIERRLPDVLATTFAELGTENGCARLFEHCLPYAHDHGWWAHLDPINIQVNLPRAMDSVRALAPQIENLRQIAVRCCVAVMTRPVALSEL